MRDTLNECKDYSGQTNKIPSEGQEEGLRLNEHGQQPRKGQSPTARTFPQNTASPQQLYTKKCSH